MSDIVPIGTDFKSEETKPGKTTIPLAVLERFEKFKAELRDELERHKALLDANYELIREQVIEHGTLLDRHNDKLADHAERVRKLEEGARKLDEQAGEIIRSTNKIRETQEALRRSLTDHIEP